MSAAPVPANETQRLRLLERHRILDTPEEDAFNDLARLASTICETPMATISLIDSERQWFKARVGPIGPETSRENAFCAHTILGDDLMIIEDARTDSRFKSNPDVTAGLNVRFYAGAPLTMPGGLNLGTLCVFDQRPRQMAAGQLDALKVLRRAVITQMELRRALQDFAAVEKLLPMCSWCRDVRNDVGGWSSLYEFVSRSGQVTHGICPTCAKKVEDEINNS